MRFKAGLEGTFLLITVIPSILLVASAQDAIVIDIPALPALGIFISVAIASVFLWTSGSSWCAIGCRGFSRPARGFLLKRFEKVFQGAPLAFFFAALTQAVLFGALHFYQGPIGIAASTTTVVILAYLYLLTGRNLIAPILAHGLINTYAITMLFLGLNPVPSFFG